MDLEIANPSTDLTMAGVTVGPATPVDINGVTIIMTANNDLTTPTTSNPSCSNSLITSVLSLHMSDQAQDPTVYYLQNCSIWKMIGGGAPRRMTNQNLQVHSLNLTDMGGGNVRFAITISNIDQGAGANFLDIVRTFSTSAGTRASRGE